MYICKIYYKLQYNKYIYNYDCKLKKNSTTFCGVRAFLTNENELDTFL